MAGSIVSQAAWCTSASIHYMRPVSDLVLGIISTIMIIILNPGTQFPGKKVTLHNTKKYYYFNTPGSIDPGVTNNKLETNITGRQWSGSSSVERKESIIHNNNYYYCYY